MCCEAPLRLCVFNIAHFARFLVGLRIKLKRLKPDLRIKDCVFPDQSFQFIIEINSVLGIPISKQFKLEKIHK